MPFLFTCHSQTLFGRDSASKGKGHSPSSLLVHSSLTLNRRGAHTCLFKRKRNNIELISHMTNIMPSLGMKQSTFSDVIGWVVFPHFVLLSPDLYWDGTGISKTNPNYKLQPAEGSRGFLSLSWKKGFLRNNQSYGKVREASKKPHRDQGHWQQKGWKALRQGYFDICKHKLIVTEGVGSVP